MFDRYREKGGVSLRPQAQPAAQDSPHAHAMFNETKTRQPALILMIDDDPLQIEFGRTLAARAGYRFRGATDGRAGLRVAREARPDVILLDYVMPGLTGKQVFEEMLRSPDETMRHTPVIMLTAQSANRAEQRELLDAGLAAYLYKPFGYHELLNVIDNVLVVSQTRERNRLLEVQARQSFIATARTLVTLLFAKDPCTAEHSNMTAEVAEAVAVNFGLMEQDALVIKLGALLHDIGKIGVPEHILCKPGALTEEEMTIMRLHVDYGDEALSGVPFMETVHEMVKYHHEWWDGRGYPFGLGGADIPFGARLVSVVDAFDSMTSDRPYRSRLSQDEAYRRLRAGAGTQFDPAIVQALFDTLSTYEPPRVRALDLQFLEELSPVV
jgi:putative two-component system response regulator